MTENREEDFTAQVDANIARNLKSMRERLGMSQAELAQRVAAAGVTGFHQTTIARIEAAKRPLRAAEALAISRVLQTSLEWMAESKVSASMRSRIDYLRTKSADYDLAARELIHARMVVASEQDSAYPYREDGTADFDEVLRSGVDPDLYEILEDLIVAAAPDERLAIAYANHLAAFSEQPRAVPSRVDLIAADMRAWMDRNGQL